MKRQYSRMLSVFLTAFPLIGDSGGEGEDSGSFPKLAAMPPPRRPPAPRAPDFLEMVRRRRASRRLGGGHAQASPAPGEGARGGGDPDSDDEARFRLAVEAADFGVFEWEVQRDVEYWSDRLKAMFGLPPETRMDESRFWPLVHPEDRGLLRAALDEAISPEGDGRLYCRYRILRRDGEPRWIEVHGRTRFREVDGAAWPVRLFGVARDVTGERAVEEAVRMAKEAAERANLAKSNLLAAASHDLRQPVQSLVLLAHAIAEHVAPAGRNMLAGLQLSTETLRELLDALLDISKLDAGVMTADIKAFPLPRLLAELGGYVGLAGQKELDFRISGCNVAVVSDPMLLGRILRNLVENAIKFTERGHVEVTCRNVAGRIEISVADTGIGIPPEHHDAIFGEFYQVGRPSLGGAKGMGLGLAIVKRLTELLGHGIRVESRPGEGTRFVVSVLRAEAADLPPGAGGEPPARLPRRGEARPLVAVLDEGPTASAIETAFRSWEADAVSGASVEALAHLLGGRSPDLAVADGRAGEALAAMRDRFGGGLPGILLTSDMEGDSLAEARRRGFLVLHKPVAPERLLSATADLLQRAWGGS
jgi:two-component system, sensor histidine kinase